MELGEAQVREGGLLVCARVCRRLYDVRKASYALVRERQPQ